MPHITLEYSANLTTFDARSCLLAINQTLLNTGEFTANDIKSRAIRCDDVVIGINQETSLAFVHVTIKLLSGRSETIKEHIAETTCNALKEHLAAINLAALSLTELQGSIDLVNLERQFYQKTLHVIP